MNLPVGRTYQPFVDWASPSVLRVLWPFGKAFHGTVFCRGMSSHSTGKKEMRIRSWDYFVRAYLHLVNVGGRLKFTSNFVQSILFAFLIGTRYPITTRKLFDWVVVKSVAPVPIFFDVSQPEFPFAHAVTSSRCVFIRPTDPSPLVIASVGVKTLQVGLFCCGSRYVKNRRVSVAGIGA